jgi:thymidine kinase
MEYFIGSMSTMILLYFVGKYRSNFAENNKQNINVRFSQSHMHELVKPLLPPSLFEKKKKDTQALKHERKTNVKVIIVDNLAYWVKDNIFYMADMDGNLIDKETTRVVDTMGMNKVELDKMLFIMDRLMEGDGDDRSGTGN